MTAFLGCWIARANENTSGQGTRDSGDLASRFMALKRADASCVEGYLFRALLCHVA